MKRKRRRVKSFFEDFGNFVRERNFIDVGIGLLTATALKDFIDTITTVLFLPIINHLLADIGVDTENSPVSRIFGIDFEIGTLINSVFTFLILVFLAYLILRSYTKFLSKMGESEEEPPEITLLTEIRDLLEVQNRDGGENSATSEEDGAIGNYGSSKGSNS